MTDINTLSINTIRIVAADVVRKANSGHPGNYQSSLVLDGHGIKPLPTKIEHGYAYLCDLLELFTS